MGATNAGIFATLVGNEVTEQKLPDIQNELLQSTEGENARPVYNAMIYIVDRTLKLKRVNILKSRYDQNISSNMNIGKALNILQVCLEDTSQIENQINYLRTQIQNEEREIETYQREKRDIGNKLNQVSATKAKLKADR